MEECDLCGVETAHSVVDHCHECGTIRGRLCRRCNKRLDRWTVFSLAAAIKHGFTFASEAREHRYLEDSHYPGERSCLKAQMTGTSYRSWIAAGRPLDWWNALSYLAAAPGGW